MSEPLPAARSVPPLGLAGWLVLPQGVRYGRLSFRDTLETVELLPEPPAAEARRYILPGFVDTHVHGGGGGDTMDGVAGVQTLARLHARCGTTSLLPTTMTNPWDRVLAALRAVRAVMDLQEQQRAQGLAPSGAQVLGAHLEGPFISPGRLGAQPPHTLEPTPELIQEVLALGCVRAVTLAPEVPGAASAARQLAGSGVRIGIGHTRADGDTVTAFLEELAPLGRLAATHLFNAMGGIEGRQPGPAGALLAHPHVFPEVIFDLQHVHPLSLHLARAACPDRVLLITDAMRAAGLGDGESELGGQAVTVHEGRATLADGTLAGSVLTMDQALRNTVASGISLSEASRMASAHPARSLGLTDRGELKVGLRADLAVLDEELRVLDVYIGGQCPAPISLDIPLQGE
ncbi:N-acetylglucosamine-6-phosphate deacetylase [Deinococcus piscis]|uniref:N-acetylglucosamine-6-phosphate deacetylase n=1 Tax=Deinococcus piscis TaxID=394230 RepID=A0ABQ3JZ10_9DEIO|nr:N-acetylglucosamine-6-phosphate deacetylase [Deinococcus piscis]GHF94616.1 N-acetylglucosamine-6-phosphate deacetylase [Deinococcus piscis]